MGPHKWFFWSMQWPHFKKVLKKPLIQTCDSGLQLLIVTAPLVKLLAYLKKKSTFRITRKHQLSVETWYIEILSSRRCFYCYRLFTYLNIITVLRIRLSFRRHKILSWLQKTRASNFVDKSKISLMMHSQNHTLRRGSGSSLGDLLRVCWFICKDLDSLFQ